MNLSMFSIVLMLATNPQSRPPALSNELKTSELDSKILTGYDNKFNNTVNGKYSQSESEELTKLIENFNKFKSLKTLELINDEIKKTKIMDPNSLEYYKLKFCNNKYIMDIIDELENNSNKTHWDKLIEDWNNSII